MGMTVSDIVERLRGLKWMLHCDVRGMIPDTTAYDAADEITRLRAEIAALKASIADERESHIALHRRVGMAEGLLMGWLAFTPDDDKTNARSATERFLEERQP